VASDAKLAASHVHGYVLAGGASRRFGSDKAVAEFAGEKLLARTCDVLNGVSADVRVVAPTGRYAGGAYEIVEDAWPGEGPLGGIITALQSTRASRRPGEWNLILGCDMPFLGIHWLHYLVERASHSGASVMVPRSTKGLEPLCACWRTSALETLRAAFDRGVRKVTDAMKLLPTEVLDETHWKRFDSDGRLFWNMNTPQDYQDALRAWSTDRSAENA